MSGVSIGRIVKVENLGAGGFEDFHQIGHDGGSVGLKDSSTGVRELNDRGVVAEFGGLALLFFSNFDELGIGGLGEWAGAWSARAIGDDHAGKAIFGVLQAGSDAREGEDFQVVGMGTDSQMSGGGEGREGIGPCWSEEISGGLGEVHRRKTQREARR